MFAKRLIIALIIIIFTCADGARSRAQMRVIPVDEQRGHVALGLALRHLNNTGVFMMATAHPDDENNGLLVMLNRGQGYRTALATATRGNGGQNEIGPEIFEALGVLRTEELAAIHRFDGAEQYFTRAVDFGMSFSVEETFEKWGREEILADYVRLIRTIRPDVITGLSPDGNGPGQHHQASAILAREAFKAAGDPAKFPEQLKAGLRVWQPKKFYFNGGAETSGRQLTVGLAGYDNLLGRTYSEIGMEARSMHKCQGTGQLLSLPGPSTAVYRLVESVLPPSQREETALFDGIDTSIAGLARFAGTRVPKELTDGLKAITTAVQDAQKRFDIENDDATVAPLLGGLRAIRVLRGQLRGMTIDEAGRYEIDLRLRQKEREFQEAALSAASVRVDALADDGVAVPGQDARVQVIVANRGLADVTVKQVSFGGFEGDASCALTAVTGNVGFGVRGGGRGAANAPATPLSTLRRNQTAQCTPTLRIPANARITEPYWHRAGEAGRYTFDDDAPFGLPYRPTEFYVQATLAFAGGEDVFSGVPVQHRYEGNIFSGEKRSDVLVVPGLSVRVSPQVVILPAAVAAPAPAVVPPPAPTGRGRGAAQTAPATQGRGRGAARPAPAPPAPAAVAPAREIRVSVVNDGKTASESVVKLTLPAGWTSTPDEQTVALAREDESRTVRFQVHPPVGAAPGAFTVKATATVGEASYARGFQVIEYPHIRRQHIYDASETTMKIVDVKTVPNLTVGYVMGVGDAVPQAIEQLGAKVELLDADDLAWGDLSRFPTIVTGVRAYERRDDLRANNSRLLNYVREGGTLIVQYNKFEFNEAQYGPWTIAVSNDRVTDERAPIVPLLPNDPLLNVPNKVTEATWSDWVQERGLYFLGEKDSRYRDVIALEDPFPNNGGEKRGALVTATYGRGRWVYLGLGLWRELPAGVDGAYQLLGNLISLNH